MVADIGTGALAGLLVGAVAGFVVAVVVLQLKRWRNGRLHAGGFPGIKDCLLTPLWLPCGFVGAVVGAITGGIAAAWRPAALAGAMFPAALLVLSTALVIRQSRDRTKFD